MPPNLPICQTRQLHTPNVRNINFTKFVHICFRIFFLCWLNSPFTNAPPAGRQHARPLLAVYTPSTSFGKTKWPRLHLHKGTPVAKRLRLLYQFWKALTVPTAHGPLCPYMSRCMAKCNLSVCLTLYGKECSRILTSVWTHYKWHNPTLTLRAKHYNCNHYDKKFSTA